MRINDKTFFRISSIILAEKLLGKIIVCCTEDGQILKYRITEVEAYGDQNDTASHAHKGLTKRTATMFEDGGTVYVYLCYGLFEILNIVSDEKGKPGGVMIRGIASIGFDNIIIGPGRVGRALKITRALNNEDLSTSKKIWLEDDGFIVKPNNIQKLKRVGISYASKEDQNKLWRLKINYSN